MERTIHWGIIGPGKIADRFASSFSKIPDANLYAVASRDEAKARAFAAEHNVTCYYKSYEKLINDPKVDVLYIATPHPFHKEQAMLCIENKKAVLCEKPLTLNYKNTLELVIAARNHNTFLMEGMWTRFFPVINKALEIIRSGNLGEIKYIKADFGFHAPFDPSGRLFDVRLGGGAMLDVGVYPLFLSLLILGKPDAVTAFAHLSTTGADEFTNALLYYNSGAIANILSAVVMDTPKTAEIIGTKGMITLHSPWHKSSALNVKMNDGDEQHFSLPYEGTGFEFEIQEVTRCLQANQKESKLMPLDFSLTLAQVSDDIRKQCGIRYPEDSLT